MSVRRDEEETKEWDRFWNSGRGDDYLRYCGCFREDEGTVMLPEADMDRGKG